MWLWTVLAWAEPAVTPPVDGAKDAALVVGIDDYLLLPDVPGADDNAAEWVEYLEARGLPRDHIVLLRDAEANDARIRARAREVAAQAEDGGRVWFVFVGHGAPNAEGERLLVGVDAAADTETLFARSVPHEELVDLLGSEGRPVVAIVDACFSGQDRAGDSLLPGLQPVVPVYGVVEGGSDTLVSAAASDQFAGSWPEVERPALSWLLLHPEAEGTLTLADGVADAERRLRSLSDRRQTPEIHGFGGVVLGERVEGVPMPSGLPMSTGEVATKDPSSKKKGKQTGWKVLGGVLGTGAVVAAAVSYERREAAANTDSPFIVDGATRSARTNAVLAWTLGGLSAASFAVVVVK